jgi:hypothetical protein
MADGIKPPLVLPKDFTLSRGGLMSQHTASVIKRANRLLAASVLTLEIVHREKQKMAALEATVRGSFCDL